MYADQGIGPVIHGADADEMRVFHGAEGLLGLALAAITQDDLFVLPGMVIGEQDGFAEDPLAETSQGLPVTMISQGEAPAALLDACLYEFLHVLPLEDVLELFLDALERGRPAAGHPALGPAAQGDLQVV